VLNAKKAGQQIDGEDIGKRDSLDHFNDTNSLDETIIRITTRLQAVPGNDRLGRRRYAYSGLLSLSSSIYVGKPIC